MTELPWQNIDEVIDKYHNWHREGAYAQAEIDIHIWWFKAIIWLLFVLIEYQQRRED